MLIPRVAAAQQGVFSRRQAREFGFSAKVIAARRREGVWVEVLHDVFALVGTPLGATARAHAAVLLTGGFVSHRTAARVHGIDVAARDVDDRVHITMPTRVHAVVAQIVEHRVRIEHDDVTNVDALPVTTRSRTVLDLMATSRRSDAASLMFRALQQGWITPDELTSAGGRRVRMHGTPQIRDLARLVGSNAHSVAERALHDILNRKPGLHWTANAPLTLPGGRRVVADVLVPGAKVVVEVDGRRFHDDADRFQADRERQNALASAGYAILRFTWYDLVERPDHVLDVVTRQLARLDSAS